MTTEVMTVIAHRGGPSAQAEGITLSMVMTDGEI